MQLFRDPHPFLLPHPEGTREKARLRGRRGEVALLLLGVGKEHVEGFRWTSSRRLHSSGLFTVTTCQGTRGAEARGRLVIEVESEGQGQGYYAVRSFGYSIRRTASFAGKALALALGQATARPSRLFP
jgi:hypothetical protein